MEKFHFVIPSEPEFRGAERGDERNPENITLATPIQGIYPRK
jgi:hypothetical protein